MAFKSIASQLQERHRADQLNETIWEGSHVLFPDMIKTKNLSLIRPYSLPFLTPRMVWALKNNNSNAYAHMGLEVFSKHFHILSHFVLTQPIISITKYRHTQFL